MARRAMAGVRPLPMARRDSRGYESAAQRRNPRRDMAALAMGRGLTPGVAEADTHPWRTRAYDAAREATYAARAARRPGGLAAARPLHHLRLPRAARRLLPASRTPDGRGGG